MESTQEPESAFASGLPSRDKAETAQRTKNQEVQPPDGSSTLSRGSIASAMDPRLKVEDLSGGWAFVFFVDFGD